MHKDEQVMAGFRDLFNKIILLNKFKMESELKDYKPSEVHCIEYVGKNSDANVTRLAEAFYMTNGAISKITKKLIEKGIMESFQRPDNKKEIYFRLTEQGKKVFNTHEDLHNTFRERDKAIFEQVTDSEFDSMLRFVNHYRKHLDLEIAKQGVDLKSE